MAKIKVKVDPEKCIGDSSCVNIATEVFELGQNGKTTVKKEYSDVEITDPAMIEKIKMAAKVCPTKAIEIIVIEE